jgi:flavin-dependent dehydrogenase
MADYDVIVVGCGPAGMMACGELARRGVKVLGIDKKPRLDVNIRTASGYCFLDQPFNREYIKRTPRGNKTELEYTDSGFKVVYGAPMEGIHHSHMFSDTGKHWQASTTKKPFYHIFNPHQCHKDRFEWAQKMGASFMTGTLFINLTQTETQVEVKVRRDGKDQRLTCRRLIAADGLCSRIAKVTNANKTRTNFGMKGPTIEYEIANVDCPYDRGDMFFFGAKNFGGRSGGIIMVPSFHGDGVYRMETMSMLPASTATDLIEYFTKQGPYAQWFKNSEVIETSGVVIEFFSPMIVPHLGNVLFAGDSAAFGECLYQCAVMCGYRGAECVEMELQGKQGFEAYTEWWADHFEWVKNPKRMADYTKRVLFPRFFTVKELDFLFDLSKKYPIVLEEAEATPYDFTTMVMQSFMAMPEVSDDLKKRMQLIIDADMAQVAQVAGKVQKS